MDLTKSQVKKAGRTVRRYHRGEATREDYLAALDVVSAYRASFSYPLTKVNNGLRGFLATLAIDAEVTQRLKRMDTIAEKIGVRETSLSLDTMGDIAGCRVTLKDDSIDDLRRVQAWIDYRWEDSVKHVRDYVESPRSSGYRAVHMLVDRDGRLVEVQRRTAGMQQWAETMESLSQAMGENFKQDRGDSPAQEFGKVLSLLYQARDGLYALTPDDMVRLRRWQEVLGGMLNDSNRGKVSDDAERA